MATNRQRLIDGLTRLTQALMGQEDKTLQDGVSFIREVIRLAKDHMTPVGRAAAEELLGDDLPDTPLEADLSLPTPTQWKVLKVLHGFRSRGISPPLTQMAKILGMTYSNVGSHLEELKKKFLVVHVRAKDKKKGKWVLTEAGLEAIAMADDLDAALGTQGFTPKLPFSDPPKEPATETTLAIGADPSQMIDIFGGCSIEPRPATGDCPAMTILRPTSGRIRIGASFPIGVMPIPGAMPIPVAPAPEGAPTGRARGPRH